MTVPTQTNKAIFTANGVTTEFPFTFGTLPTADLVVTLIDGDAETVVNPSDYTVRGAGRDDGGSVVFNEPPALGLTVLIQRLVPYTQPTDYKNQGSFYPRTHERSFDRVTMQVQQLAEEVSRSLRIRPGYTLPVSVDFPTPEASRLIGWNADGSALRNTDPSGPGDLLLRSDLADPTGGGALVSFKQAGADAINRSILDKAREDVSDLDFGLVDDPGLTTDQSVRFQAMLTHGGRIRLTPGNTYYLPTLTNATVGRATHLFGGARGLYTRLVGDGKVMFRPNHSFRIEDCEITGCSTIFGGTNGVFVREYAVAHCYCHDSGYFHSGHVNCDYFEITDNTLSGFPGALIVEASDGGSTVNIRQTFARNVVTNIGRYVYRLSVSAPLYFENNVITDVNTAGMTGSAGVARVIMRGSYTGIFIRGNKIDGVVSTDGNANLIYWTHGNLIVEGNHLGYFSDGAFSGGGYIINEKSTSPKSVVVRGNTISSDIGPMEKALVFRVSNQSGACSTLVEGNSIEHSIFPIVSILHSDRAISRPSNIVIRGNTIGRFEGSSPFAAIYEGANGVIVEGNSVADASNPSNTPLNGNEFNMVAVDLYTTAPDSEGLGIDNVVVASNVIRYTDTTPGQVRAIIRASTLQATNRVYGVSVSGNVMSGGTHFVRIRQNNGTIGISSTGNKSVGVVGELDGPTPAYWNPAANEIMPA